MTKSETSMIFSVLTAAYPRFDTFKDKEEARPVVELWAEMLADIPFSVVELAVKKLVLESPYPPTIADVRKRAVEIMTPPEDRIDAAEAWGEVIRAMRFYGYYQEKEALESMSPRVARVVKYMGWQEICLSDQPGVARGQFLKMYQQVAEREQKERLLPDVMRKEMQRIADGMNVKLITGVDGNGTH